MPVYFIDQLTKKFETNFWAIANLLKYLAQLLPSNRLQSCGAQKTRADKKFGTYRKSADTKITLKETLTYPMKYTAQILPGVTNDVGGHKKSSADLKIWD